MLSLSDISDSNKRSEIEEAIRASCNSSYMGSGVSLCRVLTRYKMFVYNNDISLSPHLILDGFWEFWITSFVCNIVKPGQKILEIGANFGYYTLLFADAVGHSGRVHAFEPNPKLFSLLQKTVNINGFNDRVTLSDVAITDSYGEINLSVPKNEYGGGSVYMADVSSDEYEVYKVKTSPLDDLQNDFDLIKIDAEGAEPYIITGGMDFIKNYKGCIIMEYDPNRFVQKSDALQFIEDTFSIYKIGYDSKLQKTSFSDIRSLCDIFMERK